MRQDIMREWLYAFYRRIPIQRQTHPRAWKLTPRSARGVFAVPINHKGNRSDPSAFEYLLSLQQMQMDQTDYLYG
jgi:hypothetical protein